MGESFEKPREIGNENKGHEYSNTEGSDKLKQVKEEVKEDQNIGMKRGQRKKKENSEKSQAGKRKKQE